MSKIRFGKFTCADREDFLKIMSSWVTHVPRRLYVSPDYTNVIFEMHNKVEPDKFPVQVQIHECQGKLTKPEGWIKIKKKQLLNLMSSVSVRILQINNIDHDCLTAEVTFWLGSTNEKLEVTYNDHPLKLNHENTIRVSFKYDSYNPFATCKTKFTLHCPKARLTLAHSEVQSKNFYVAIGKDEHTIYLSFFTSFWVIPNAPMALIHWLVFSVYNTKPNLTDRIIALSILLLSSLGFFLSFTARPVRPPRFLKGLMFWLTFMILSVLVESLIQSFQDPEDFPNVGVKKGFTLLGAIIGTFPALVLTINYFLFLKKLGKSFKHYIWNNLIFYTLLTLAFHVTVTVFIWKRPLAVFNNGD